MIFSRNLRSLNTTDPIPPLPSYIEGATKQILGFVPNSTRQMMQVPGLLPGFGALMQSSGHHKIPFWRGIAMGIQLWRQSGQAKLSIHHRDLAAYACSLSAGSQYCQAHTAHTMVHHNLSKEQVQDVRNYETSEHFDDAQRSVIALALAAGRHPNGAEPAHFEALNKHFNQQQISELVMIIATFGFLNRWNDTMATQLEETPQEFATEVLTKSGWDGTRHGAGD